MTKKVDFDLNDFARIFSALFVRIIDQYSLKVVKLRFLVEGRGTGFHHKFTSDNCNVNIRDDYCLYYNRCIIDM